MTSRATSSVPQSSSITTTHCLRSETWQMIRVYALWKWLVVSLLLPSHTTVHGFAAPPQLPLPMVASSAPRLRRFTHQFYVIIHPAFVFLPSSRICCSQATGTPAATPPANSMTLHPLHMIAANDRRNRNSMFTEPPLMPQDDENCDIDELENCGFPYTLPPPNRDLTQLEKEFRNMFTDFASYTERDIMSIENHRLRAVFEGVGAGARDPPVYRAFEVLFEDMLPLRIAGRMIFNKLKQVMADSQVKRQVQVEWVAASTGLDQTQVEANRVAFMKLAADSQKESGEAQLTIQQLIDTGIADTVVELLGFENFDEFLQSINTNRQGSVGFSDLMIALQRCSRESGDLGCNPATVLPELAKRMAATKDRMERTKTSLSMDQRKRKYSEDYDAMVDTFKKWEGSVPTGEGRLLDVLRGCFAGARNAKVMEALRIVYVDYSALRVAGNLIFKLMSSLMARHQKS